MRPQRRPPKNSPRQLQATELFFWCTPTGQITFSMSTRLTLDKSLTTTLSGFPLYVRILRLWPAHIDLFLKMSSRKQVVLGICISYMLNKKQFMHKPYNFQVEISISDHCVPHDSLAAAAWLVGITFIYSSAYLKVR